MVELNSGAEVPLRKLWQWGARTLRLGSVEVYLYVGGPLAAAKLEIGRAVSDRNAKVDK